MAMIESPELLAQRPHSIDDFTYELPSDLVAALPLPVRHQSRLLVLNRHSSEIAHTQFKNLSAYLRAGDLLVINDTKVIPAKILARRPSGGLLRLLLIKPEANQSGLWQAMVSPIKRLKIGESLLVCSSSGSERSITIKDMVIGDDGFKRVLVDLGSASSVFDLLNEIGLAPLPSYIRRETIGYEESHPATLERAEQARAQRIFDLQRYQTIFAKAPGAVAAPTAGLHFSEELLAELASINVEICSITLHVGPGTFKPITKSIDDHFVEPESYWIPAQTAKQISKAKAEGRRVIAVGTTSLRALETAAENNQVRAVNGERTALYVRPGHKFKIVDALITNFHLSRSSLLVLVSALAGRDLIMSTYKEAIEQRYRFYSYGDAMLIL